MFAMAESLGVSSEEVLYIGDSEVDAATGNAADMDTVLVEWGFRSREELEKADAYRIVAAADEILDIIKNYLMSLWQKTWKKQKRFLQTVWLS